MDRVPYQQLSDKITRIFTRRGFHPDDAAVSADVWLQAEARDYPTQGLVRVQETLNFIEAGKIHARRDFKRVAPKPTIAKFECDGHLGHPVAKKAAEEAVRLAKIFGSSTVSVSNAGHIAYLTYYAELMAAEDCYATIMTVSSPAVGLAGVPTGGTNPICYAFPYSDEGIFCADFSTAATSRGVVIAKREAGLQFDMPMGHDPDGNSTTDPEQILAGCISPLGGGINGLLLNMQPAVFCGPLTGNVPNHLAGGTRFANESVRKGDVFQCVDLSDYGSKEERNRQLQEYFDRVTENSKGRFHIPGETSRKKLAHVIEHGFEKTPIVETVLAMH